MSKIETFRRIKKEYPELSFDEITKIKDYINNLETLPNWDEIVTYVETLKFLPSTSKSTSTSTQEKKDIFENIKKQFNVGDSKDLPECKQQ